LVDAGNQILSEVAQLSLINDQNRLDTEQEREQEQEQQKEVTVRSSHAGVARC
jgi:hypothetical protein